MIIGSKLTLPEMRRVIEALPEEIREKRIAVIAESLPNKSEDQVNRPGASYVAVLHIKSKDYSKWAVVEVSFVGSLHASRTHRGTGQEGIKTNLHTFDSLEELLDPLNLTDVVRLRLGKQIWGNLAKR